MIDLVVANPEKSLPPITLKAVVDSGADYTIIPMESIEKLGLPIRKIRDVGDFTGGRHKVTLYFANITIPSLNEHPIMVIGMKGAYVLAGRDILNLYKVTLDGRQKKIEIE